MRSFIAGLGSVGDRVSSNHALLAERMYAAPVGSTLRSDQTGQVYTKEAGGAWIRADRSRLNPTAVTHTAFFWVSFPDEAGPVVGGLLPTNLPEREAAMDAAPVGSVIYSQRNADLRFTYDKQVNGQWRRRATAARGEDFPVKDYNTDAFGVRFDYTWEVIAEEPKTDVQKIGRALIAEATRRGWCPDYDLFVAALNESLDEKLPTRS